jgi:hypothetical protein
MKIYTSILLAATLTLTATAGFAMNGKQLVQDICMDRATLITESSPFPVKSSTASNMCVQMTKKKVNGAYYVYVPTRGGQCWKVNPQTKQCSEANVQAKRVNKSNSYWVQSAGYHAANNAQCSALLQCLSA